MEAFDRLQSLGRMLIQDDPNFNPQTHQAQQLESGPYKDTADRLSLWEQWAPEHLNPTEHAESDPLLDAAIQNRGMVR